ncbi:Hpt domain-containing protein, partial [bacterium]|nr:Hpt domain-containing protein [bacterium]
LPVVDEIEQKLAADKLEKNIIGIDMKEGLAICLDNPKLYDKILGMFCQYYRDFELDFQTVQQDEEPQVATRLAHTLKGAAGEIGATEIPRLAQQLETLCREGQSRQEIRAALQELLNELNPLIAAVDSFLAEVTDEF